MATVRKPREIEYPDSDGKPLAESDVHITALFDLRIRLKAWLASRTDAYAAGNMLVYYVEGNPKASLAPDGFVVFGVENKDRRSFKTWVEGAIPAVVFEITSKSTRKEDLVKKMAIYRDIWKVQEYFLFDPLEEYLDPSLQGYRRVRGTFAPMPSTTDRLTSAALGVTLERYGKYLQLRDAATGQIVRTSEEAKAQEAITQADTLVARLLATAAQAEQTAHRAAAQVEKAKALMDQASAQLESAKVIADTATARTAAIEAENARLQAELAILRKQVRG